jgi:hypothetical protein
LLGQKKRSSYADGLTLDIKFMGFKDEWIEYEIKFYWKDEIIINDSLLKREGEYWGKRSTGAFLANDYQKDFLTETIRDILQTNEPEYWEPLEPDDIFTIITLIDSYTFKNNMAYSGEGISLHLIVTRNDLEKFADQLEKEYRNLKS